MNITFKNESVTLAGNPPEVGQVAPDVTLVNTDLSEVKLSDYRGRKVVFNVFPSVDTSVCALQLQTFSEQVKGLGEDVVLLFASVDLPFAFKRFCGAEANETAVTGSDFRYGDVAKNYALRMEDGPLTGLYARSVFVIDEQGVIQYREIVGEVTHEPNYQAALAALS